MPAIVGPVQFFNVGGGVVQFGDTAVISPKSNSKGTTGSGSNSTGGFVLAIGGISANTTIDSNLVDQPTIGNS
ncbi:spore germination protein [Bacillus sp. FSL K6-3431]|uniref:spore germination protein n=1 Tax=Bacillus sp. FSL K6-3431 TaxID=2921500 RepID=UPI0030F9BA2B